MVAAAEHAWIDRRACSPVRVRSGCSACARSCPIGAMTFSGATPVISDLCFGCGRCAANCPVGALQVRGFTEAADPARRAGEIRIECVRAPSADASDAVRVPCLGGLTVAHLLALRLAASGAAVILMDRGWCGDCPAGGGGTHPAERCVAKVRDLLAAHALPETLAPILQRHPLPPTLRDDRTARGGLSRRGLFRRWTASSGDTECPSPVPPELTKVPPAARMHLRQMTLLRRLAERHGKVSIEPLLPAIHITERCRDTGSCSAYCPTGALHLWQNSTAQGVSFEPRICIACGLCVRACKHGAIRLDRLSKRHAADGRVVVTIHRLGRCRQCGVELPGLDAAGHCPRCRNGIGLLNELARLSAASSAQSNGLKGAHAP